MSYIRTLLNRFFLRLATLYQPRKPQIVCRVCEKPESTKTGCHFCIKKLTKQDVSNLLGIKGFREDSPSIQLPEEQLDTWFLTCDREKLIKYERIQSHLRKIADGDL